MVTIATIIALFIILLQCHSCSSVVMLSSSVVVIMVYLISLFLHSYNGSLLAVFLLLLSWSRAGGGLSCPVLVCVCRNVQFCAREGGKGGGGGGLWWTRPATSAKMLIPDVSAWDQYPGA